MEAISVPPDAEVVGMSLKELAPAQRYNVQIAGIRRGGFRLINPGAAESLQPGDELLAVGTPAEIEEFRRGLMQQTENRQPPEGAGVDTASFRVGASVRAVRRAAC